MFYVTQYHGRLIEWEQGLQTFEEAQELCKKLEKENPGACFIWCNSQIVGDAEGRYEPTELEPYWSRCGNVMHGREHE